MRKLKKYTPTKFKAKDSVYDKAAADYAVNFIECLCHTKGTWAGQKFELIDWQEQIVRDIFGILKPNGYRQFNTAYIEIPKKMGKSELAAAVALLLCCGDGEERAEVYGCAADRQQASIVFEVAADMVRMCPALNKRVKILAATKRIVYLPTNSFYQVLSAEAYSKHGFNIHGVVFDELHTQPNRKLFDVMTKGSGDARMQPLYFLITTAGTDSLKSPYRKNAIWVLNDATIKLIRKLKDSNGQYLWQPALRDGEYDTILGKKIFTSPYAPIAEADAKSIIFGDLSYYWIGDRQGITFRRLNEKYAETGQVGFIATKRVDAKLILPEAVKVLQMKAE